MVIRTRKLPLVLIVVFLACFAQSEQTDGRQESVSAVVSAGLSTYRVVLTLAEPPASGDRIQASVTTDEVRTKLITPDGKTITAENAEGAGLRWLQMKDHPSPLESDDPGQATWITFGKHAPAGRYTLEFAFKELHAPARVEARFISLMGEYRRKLQAIPGAQISKPVPLSPSATVTIDLPQDEDEFMFDIVVPDAHTDVVLVLPDGRKLRLAEPLFVTDPGPGGTVPLPDGREFRRDDLKPSNLEWTMVPKFALELYRNMGELLPVEGNHRVVLGNKAAKGHYQITASQKTTASGKLRVAAVPYKALAEATGAWMAAMDVETGQISRTGGIQIRPEHLPYDAFVGDKLDFQFELLGDIGPQPPQFEVREERSAWLRYTDTGVQYAPPDPVEVLPVQLIEVGPRTYRGTVVPTKPGNIRISLKATGKTASGEAFSTETLLTNSSMTVKPVAARFLGITAQASISGGSSKFDRFEVAAALDVLIPGEYLLGFDLKDADGRQRVHGSGTAALQQGRQTLTGSVRSSEIWTQFRNGPFEIFNVQISRTGENTMSDNTMSWIDVPTADATLKTAAYKRDQWAPGPIYGEDHVTVHGIGSSAAGKFLFAEVDWEVTTPGGSCSWGGSIQGATGTYQGERVIPDARSSEEGTLPPGKTKVSFLFDGATINRFGKQDWRLTGGVSCASAAKPDDSEERLRFSLTSPQTISFNPDEYEPAHGSFAVRVEPTATRLSPGDTRYIRVWVPNKTSKDVKFAARNLPNGVDAKFSPPLDTERQVQSSLKITVSSSTQAGRYFPRVTGTSGGEVATTIVVLDIVLK